MGGITGTRAARVLALAVLALAMGGCGWFSWVPWIGDKDKGPDPMKPAELVDFVPEVRLERQWRASIGKGLGRKYLRLNPIVVANRVYAADGYGVVEARDRFSGKRVWRSQISPYNVARGGRFSGLTGFNFFDRADPSFVSGGVGAGGGMVLMGTTGGNSGAPSWAAKSFAVRRSGTMPSTYRPSTAACWRLRRTTAACAGASISRFRC